MTQSTGEHDEKARDLYGVGRQCVVCYRCFRCSALERHETLPDSNVQNVRMVCDENGRCWRQRGERRVIIRDSYDYAPRERYYERRGYEDRGGIGFVAPGVSVGIGTGRY